LELGDFLGGGNDAERTEAIALWTSIAKNEEATTSIKADALERLARVASMNGDLKTTIELIGAARELGVDPNAKRQLEAEWFALHHDGAAAGALQSYFFPPLNVAVDAPTWALMAALAEPDLGFGFYLLGLQLANASDWHRSAVMLAYSLERGLPDISFVRNGARKLAVEAYRAHDTALVEQAITTLRAPGMSETDRLLADDWSQRLRFDADGHL
jgi:hypothetical protein